MAERGSNFNKILKEKGIKKSDISKATGIPYSCLCDWSHGRYTPKIDKLTKVAEYLDVSVDILSNDVLPIIPLPSMAEDSVELIDYYVRLNDNDKGLLIEMAKNMVERGEILKKYGGINNPTS